MNMVYFPNHFDILYVSHQSHVFLHKYIMHILFIAGYIDFWFLVLYIFLIFIYLAALGLSCSMWGL